MQSKLLTSDHPAARGRKPQPGESEYQLSFTLEDGSIMTVAMGKRGFDTVTDLLMDMLIEAPSHDDGSLKSKQRETHLQWREIWKPESSHGQLLASPRGWKQMTLFVIDLPRGDPTKEALGILSGALIPDDQEKHAAEPRHYKAQMVLAEQYYTAFFDRAPKP